VVGEHRPDPDPAGRRRVEGREGGEPGAPGAGEYPHLGGAAGPRAGDHVGQPVPVHVPDRHPHPAGERRLVGVEPAERAGERGRRPRGQVEHGHPGRAPRPGPDHHLGPAVAVEVAGGEADGAAPGESESDAEVGQDRAVGAADDHHPGAVGGNDVGHPVPVDVADGDLGPAGEGRAERGERPEGAGQGQAGRAVERLQVGATARTGGGDGVGDGVGVEVGGGHPHPAGEPGRADGGGEVERPGVHVVGADRRPGVAAQEDGGQGEGAGVRGEPVFQPLDRGPAGGGGGAGAGEEGGEPVAEGEEAVEPGVPGGHAHGQTPEGVVVGYTGPGRKRGRAVR
jgi:hypothetical protein